jgi:DNA-binding transcriptional MerR regulator
VTNATSVTIDELAQRTGMTVRNVRAHQSRGLLPPPEIRGRTGYYGGDHVARLELIKDLQAEGFNLEAIRRILERAPGRSAAGILEFTRAVAAPFTEEQPEVVQGSELVERWGEQPTPEVVERAERLGLVRPLGDGRYEVASPRLQRASEELSELGVPLETALDVIAVVKRHAAAVSRQYVRLFLEHVWAPFEEAGEPEERWGEMRETLDRLRPLATESLVAIFQIVMTREVERTLERELVRAGRAE